MKENSNRSYHLSISFEMALKNDHQLSVICPVSVLCCVRWICFCVCAWVCTIDNLTSLILCIKSLSFSLISTGLLDTSWAAQRGNLTQLIETRIRISFSHRPLIFTQVFYFFSVFYAIFPTLFLQAIGINSMTCENGTKSMLFAHDKMLGLLYSCLAKKKTNNAVEHSRLTKWSKSVFIFVIVIHRKWQWNPLVTR